MGRIVITHSTYIDGLIPILKKLVVKKGIKTITPGIIKRTRGRSEKFHMRVSATIKNGFKVIARKGNSCQEVFIICYLDKSAMEKELNELL